MMFAEIKEGEPPSVCVSTWQSRGSVGMLPQEKFHFRLSDITCGAFSYKYLTIKDIC